MTLGFKNSDNSPLFELTFVAADICSHQSRKSKGVINDINDGFIQLACLKKPWQPASRHNTRAPGTGTPTAAINHIIIYWNWRKSSSSWGNDGSRFGCLKNSHIRPREEPRLIRVWRSSTSWMQLNKHYSVLACKPTLCITPSKTL